jgi:hypothetical protein
MITKRRTDSKIEPNGQLLVIEAFECIGAHPLFTQYMLLGYPLRGAPEDQIIKHLAGASHEFVICSMAPDTPIEWGKNLFQQHTLSPLQPPNLGFQVALQDDPAFLSLLGSCMRAISAGSLSPDPIDKHTWDRFLPAAFPMHHGVGADQLMAQAHTA